MVTFLTRFALYAVSASVFSALCLLLLCLGEKRLKSSACLLLLTLMLIRIFLPMGLFGHSVFTLGGVPENEVRVEDETPSSDETALTKPDYQVGEPIPIPPQVSMGNGEANADVRVVSFWEDPIANTVAMCAVFGISFLSLSVYLISDALTRRRLKRSACRVTDPELLSLYTQIADARHLDQLPALYVSPFVTSPCLVGLFSPRIYLSDNRLYSDEELALLLAHELEHHRKGDLFKKFFALSIISFQWWNPFLRPLVKRLDLYLEEACDERVLEDAPDTEVLSYSTLMLKLCKIEQKRRAHERMTAYFSENKGKDLKKRMQRLLDGKVRSRGLFLIISVLLVSIATLFLVGFAPQSENTEPGITTPAITTQATPSGDDLYPSTDDPDSLTPAEKEGYSFSHWERVTVDGEEMLQAIYTPKSYTVTFRANGGSLPTNEQTLFYTAPLPAATRDGFTFAGWFTDAALTIPITSVPAGDVTVYAFWLEETNTSRFRFEIHGGEATVTEFYGTGDVVLPAYYGGYPVTTIGKYAFEGDAISHITIPSTVTTIGAGAFYNCRTLESVILYEGITYIDRVAFDACYSLETVYYVGSAASWQAIAGKSPSLPVTYLS